MSTSISDPRREAADRRLRIATWLSFFGFLLACWLFADTLGRAFFDQACGDLRSPPRCDWIDREAIGCLVLAPAGPAWLALIVVRIARWWKRQDHPLFWPRLRDRPPDAPK